jgi:hypothetical protein
MLVLDSLLGIIAAPSEQRWYVGNVLFHMYLTVSAKG